MFKANTNYEELKISLKHTAKRIDSKRHLITNEAAKRLQRYVQKSVDTEHTKGTTKVLRTINRGGVHKRKLAHGAYQVYMKADYAKYVEFGTRRNPRASHFFGKAVNHFERAYVDIARDIATDIIEYHWGR